MFIIFPITMAVLIVTVGYFAMWTSSKSDTPKCIASFGRVMAIILFVIAAIILAGGLAYGPRMHHRMMGGQYMGMHEKMMGDMDEKENAECGPSKMMEKCKMSEKGMKAEKGKMTENKGQMPKKAVEK